jgi:phosphatidylglycerophosphate synthase
MSLRTVAEIHASEARPKTTVLGMPPRRALILAMARAGVTDVVWIGARREEVLRDFAGLGDGLPRFHFDRQTRPAVVLDESDVLFHPEAIRLMVKGDPVPANLILDIGTDAGRQHANDVLFTELALKGVENRTARFMKSVLARPFIWLFLRLPVSANAVTLLGFVLVLASGAAFARGEYGWTVVGGVLSVLSAIFDHTDGAIARLKFQKSAFGCWLETATDLLSYVVIYAGIFAGLHTRSGNPLWIWVGVATSAGVLLSILSAAVGRRLVAPKDKPDDFYRIMRSGMRANSGRNRWVAIGGRLQFIPRRSFFPLGVLAFALFNRLDALAWLTLPASHAYWIMNLYYVRLVMAPRVQSQQ